MPEHGAGMDDRVRDAEACGMIAGALAAGETPQTAAELGATVAGENTRDALSAFAAEGLAAMREDRFALSASLSGSSLPLALRVAMLAAWARGFLSGLGQAGARLGALGADGEEMLGDLDAMSRGAAVNDEMGDKTGDETGDETGEAQERAYSELVAYLQLAAAYFYRALS